MDKKSIPDGWRKAKHGLIVPIQYEYIDIMDLPVSRIVVTGFKPDPKPKGAKRGKRNHKD